MKPRRKFHLIDLWPFAIIAAYFVLGLWGGTR
jgi:hypothetical protein